MQDPVVIAAHVDAQTDRLHHRIERADALREHIADQAHRDAEQLLRDPSELFAIALDPECESELSALLTTIFLDSSTSRLNAAAARLYSRMYGITAARHIRNIQAEMQKQEPPEDYSCI